MASEIIFYDLPSKGKCASWSLNPWKTRLALNFKGVPYKTEWTEYPDISPKFKKFGLPPNDQGSSYAEYSIPAVTFPDGTHIMESLQIARELEKRYPQPSMHLDESPIERTQTAVLHAFQPLAPIAMPRIPRDLLNEPSAAYFHETRSKRFGMPLEDFERSDKARTAWETARPGMEEIKQLLHEDESGPFIMGKEVSYSDFILAGLWQFAKRLGDLFDNGMAFDESFIRHYEACKPWLERDDH